MTPIVKMPYPDTMVTLDHLFHKSDPRRLLPCRGEKRYVAACRKCNSERGAEHDARLGIDELRRRSGRPGRGALQFRS